MTDAVHKTVVGVCEKIDDPKSEGGFSKFHIRVDGYQWPVKLDTKKPELVNAAKNVGGQRAVWGFLESQGKPNPKGGFYMNRYLDSVTLDVPNAEELVDIAETPAAPHPAESADAPPPPVDWDAKDLRKHRQAAVAIAVASYKDDPLITEDGIFRRAERIVEFVYMSPEDLIDAATRAMGGLPIDESIPFG